MKSHFCVSANLWQEWRPCAPPCRGSGGNLKNPWGGCCCRNNMRMSATCLGVVAATGILLFWCAVAVRSGWWWNYVFASCAFGLSWVVSWKGMYIFMFLHSQKLCLGTRCKRRQLIFSGNEFEKNRQCHALCRPHHLAVTCHFLQITKQWKIFFLGRDFWPFLLEISS